MRVCGECNLCCKLLTIPTINKSSNTWCKFCHIGKGCTIHETKPQVCKDFSCMWLRDETMPDDWRPDRTHVFVSGSDSDDALKMFVDSDYPDAWQNELGQKIVGSLVSNGKHVLVVIDKQINFVPALGKILPEKLVVEWLL